MAHNIIVDAIACKELEAQKVNISGEPLDFYGSITDPDNMVNKAYVDSMDFWQRVGTILSPKTTGDDITTTGTGTFGEIIDNGDLTFVGAGSGLPYGGIWCKDANTTITISTSGEANKVQVTGFTNNGTANLTTPDYTTSDITATKTGVYRVEVTVSANSVAGGGGNFGFEIYKNNGATGFPNVHANTEFAGGTGETKSITLIGHISLTAGDTVELWLWNETATNNIVINDCNISILMIGG